MKDLVEEFRAEMLSGCCSAPLRTEFYSQTSAVEKVCERCGCKCNSFIYKPRTFIYKSSIVKVQTDETN